MLLAVNLNFVAFSHFLGDMAGPGVRGSSFSRSRPPNRRSALAILVVLFRNRATINVDELDALKG